LRQEIFIATASREFRLKPRKPFRCGVYLEIIFIAMFKLIFNVLFYDLFINHGVLLKIGTFVSVLAVPF
jgi:hypothetical protein